MPIRPEPILIAAQRWLELLPVNGETRTRVTFTTVAKYGDLTSTQYESAYDWLRSAGMLQKPDNTMPPNQQVLKAAIETSDAPWLPNADEFADDPKLLPADVVAAAEALGVEYATAAGYVQSAWRKIDLALRHKVGAAGEIALVELIETHANARVEHVALWADGLGYDIAVSSGRHLGHLEVKSTTRRQRLTLHLSRNEYRTSRRDPNWMLVALHLDPENLSLRSVANVDSDWLARQMPRDSGEYGAWDSCRVDVPASAILPGLGFLTPIFGENVGAVQGFFSWPAL